MKNIWNLILIYLSLRPYKRITINKDLIYDMYKDGRNKRIRNDR